MRELARMSDLMAGGRDGRDARTAVSFRIKRDGIRAGIEMVLVRTAAMDRHVVDAVRSQHSLRHFGTGNAKRGRNPPVLFELGLNVERSCAAYGKRDDNKSPI